MCFCTGWQLARHWKDNSEKIDMGPALRGLNNMAEGADIKNDTNTSLINKYKLILTKI